MTRYIDENMHRHGVEPICDLVPIAPSTCYQTKMRAPSRRALRDAELEVQIRRVYEDNFSCNGPARCGVSSAGRAMRWPGEP